MTGPGQDVVVVLAHGGGAPEAAMVGLPVLVLVAFAVLERRARRREAQRALQDGADDRETDDA
jgi:predicted esterase